MVKQITTQDFETEVMNSSLPVLVDFYADWCGPCKMISPIVDSLSEELAGKVKFCKLNIDENTEIATKYSVMSIPTLIVFKDGTQAAKTIGLGSKEALSDMIQKVL